MAAILPMHEVLLAKKLASVNLIRGECRLNENQVAGMHIVQLTQAI
jgi:hypothetical protein